MRSVVLDTNVLWPSRQRDFLLPLAVEGLYRPRWSDAVLAELAICEVDKLLRVGVAEDEAERSAAWLLAQLATTFSDALVQGWEGLGGTFGLPDPDDEYLVAAAILGGADAIITSNVRHFPAHLLPDGIEVLTPAEFATSTTELDPSAALRAVEAIVRRTGARRPSLNVTELLDALAETYRFDAAVRMIRDVAG